MAKEIIFAYKLSLSCSYRSLTCRKCTKWGRRIYLPSEGSRAMDFYRSSKSHRSRPGLNSWVQLQVRCY
jgi:hypothetical protein